MTLGTIIIVLAAIPVRCRSLTQRIGDRGGGFVTIVRTKDTKQNGRAVVRHSLAIAGLAQTAVKNALGILINMNFGRLPSRLHRLWMTNLRRRSDLKEGTVETEVREGRSHQKTVEETEHSPGGLQEVRGRARRAPCRRPARSPKAKAKPKPVEPELTLQCP